MSVGRLNGLRRLSQHWIDQWTLDLELELEIRETDEFSHYNQINYFIIIANFVHTLNNDPVRLVKFRMWTVAIDYSDRDQWIGCRLESIEIEFEKKRKVDWKSEISFWSSNLLPVANLLAKRNFICSRILRSVYRPVTVENDPNENIEKRTEATKASSDSVSVCDCLCAPSFLSTTSQ